MDLNSNGKRREKETGLKTRHYKERRRHQESNERVVYSLNLRGGLSRPL